GSSPRSPFLCSSSNVVIPHGGCPAAWVNASAGCSSTLLYVHVWLTHVPASQSDTPKLACATSELAPTPPAVASRAHLTMRPRTTHATRLVHLPVLLGRHLAGNVRRELAPGDRQLVDLIGTVGEPQRAQVCVGRCKREVLTDAGAAVYLDRSV